MAKRDLKTTSQNLFLVDESELPVEILDRIAGGIVGVSKPKEESKEANIGAATDAAPEFQHTGTTQASASAGVVNGTATASAGASAGHTQQGTLGDVIVTNKYTISAAANATASPTGVGAGATVGAGVSTTFDLGKNVEIETATTISGKVGVAVGVENGSLKGTVGAKAGVESSVEQRYTSDTFGDGAKVKQTAYAKAEISAEAGAEGTLGAGGAKMKTVTTAGAAYRAGVTAEVGNDTATSKVSAGVISPGAFSQGVTGGATYDGGKLKLEIGGEIAIGIAGASLKLDLGLQLFDNTHTVGSDKEIKDVETAIKTIAASAGGMLTDTLQRDLAQDAAEAKQVAQRATLGRSDAQRSADQYNQQVEKRADEMEDKLKEVLELKAKVAAQPASQKNADQLKNLAVEEKEVRNKIGQWQKEMESPEEVKKRSQIQNNLIIQEKKSRPASGCCTRH
ncbi:hypothetical protein VZ95_18200 [Elstera litoralis]|uniref:Uncharacterized protein n=1 Tax=Elstera litoralis TaxID=552518 RepID=A0A0F3INP1_9PROT|nr:hypothetical protein [Elstera litoralis]KJV08376.1 hypothetical protein VZ95_18200 [Elstera litoralis]